VWKSGEAGAPQLQVRLLALLRIFQNDAAAIIVDQAPLLDFLDRTETSETGEIIIQAAIAYARGSNAAVEVTHLSRSSLREVELDHTGNAKIRAIHHSDCRK
jgi:hypothetical protein